MYRHTHFRDLLHLAVAAAVVAVFSVLANAAGGAPGAVAAPDFTWKLVSRTGVATVPKGRDGSAVTRELHEPAYVQAQRFTVLLDACKVAGRGPQYVWAGASVSPRMMPPRRAREPLDERLEGTCLFQARLPQGKHRLTVRVADGPRVGTRVTRMVSVRDYLIVSIGDSLAAGEGAPDELQQFDALGFVRRGPLWKDRHCHRSANAASAKAAAQIENADPRSSVTFVHLGCSGAKIGVGLLKKYGGVECRPSIPSTCQHTNENDDFGQLQELKRIVGHRRIDALLISIGVNDIGFARLGTACLLPPIPFGPQECTVLEGEGAGALGSLLDGSDDSYQELKKQITDQGLNVAPASIHLYEYPDITTDAEGLHSGFFDNVLAMWPIENVWAASVVRRLNEKINAAASAFGWNVISGASVGFRGHGLAAGSARWANTPFDSLLVQGPWPAGCPHAQSFGANLTWLALYTQLPGAIYGLVCEGVKVGAQAGTSGSLHPNPRGYAHIGDLITGRLLGGARILRYEVPENVIAGRQVPIGVLVRNTGVLTWEPGEYTLGASGGAGSAWGLDSVPLRQLVPPGAEVTFTFAVTAPAEPDDYYLGWQMRRGALSFGQGTGLVPITVNPGSEPVCVTLRRQQNRLVGRIAALQRELASISTADPDWREKRLALNNELRLARGALEVVNGQIREKGCR